MLAMTTCDESKLKYSNTLRIFQQFNFCTYKKQLIDIIYLSPFLVTLETFNLMELSQTNNNSLTTSTTYLNIL